MATVTQIRTLNVGSTGDDVQAFQHVLNRRYAAWQIQKVIGEDGDFGPETQAAVQEVCTGLGIDPAALSGGVTPGLRIRIRHPDKRTATEKARSRTPAARQFRAALRKQHKADGRVIIAPSANLAGKPVAKLLLDYVARMAARIGGPITITTGTNHSKFTVNGNISDHFSGHAADIGMAANGGSDDSPVGDRIMEAALLEAGFGAAQAKASAGSGGLFTIADHNGMRIQCIWKTNEGGNHHNHVHVGVRPV